YESEGAPRAPAADAELYGLHALYRLYPAAEGWVFLACPRDEEWLRLCHALGRRDLLEDARFCSAAARRANDAALVDALLEILAGQSTRQSLRELGYQAEEIADLATQRVIGWDEP